jgi:peptide/nickel transport system substrate-binding protein
MTERRFTRQTFVGGAGGTIAALYLAACGGSSSKLPPSSTGTSSTPTVSGPDPERTGGSSGSLATPSAVPSAVPGPPAQGGTRGGRIVDVFDQEGTSGYDPALTYGSTGWDGICNLLFAPLYAYSATGTPQANAAADMPSVNAAGTVYTIRLRPGVKFHNGRAVVADDYKYAWSRVLDPKLESWAASYIYSIKGAQQLYAGKATSLEGVRVVDPMTLEVTLTAPDATFMYALTQPFMAPVPKEVVEKLGKGFQTHTVGNGPFRLASYDSQGQKAIFQRFDDYFWPGLPYLDEVEQRWGLTQGVQLLMLQRGEIQMMAYGLTPRSLAQIAASSKLRPFLYEQSLLANRWINLDPRVPAFRNQAVRQALNWATDRDQLQRVTAGESTAWGAAFPKEMLAAGTRTATPYTYDPEKAASLIKQAGVGPITATLWISIDPEPQIGQVLQQQWQTIGVDLKLKQASADAIGEFSGKGQCDAWVSTYYAIYPTAIDEISQYWETGGSANYTKYSNPKVDALTKQARATADPAARDALLAQVEQELGTDAAGVFIENTNWQMAIDPRKLRNFHYSGVYGPYYDRLWVA